jgi:DNA-binding transcriptional regulator GbsR (MarR family)
MDEIRHAIIEDFGNGYASFGHSELMGRVVGLLICTGKPLTVDHISEELQVSKSPVSQICRRLEELNLIRRVWIKGERKYHYQIIDDVFLQASINLYRLNEGNLQIAEKNLQAVVNKFHEADEAEKAELRVICARLIEMREFYRQLIESYKQFIEAWQVARASLPSVDEFLQRSELPFRSETRFGSKRTRL